MKIIQNGLKDYYDHVAYAYGGGDPRVVYSRTRIGSWNNDYQRVNDLVVEFNDYPHLGMPYKLEKYHHTGAGFDELIVCGKAFPIVQVDGGGRFSSSERWEVFNFQRHKHLLDRDQIKRIDEAEKEGRPGPAFPVWVGKELPPLVELSRLVGHPIFVVKASWNRVGLTIDGNYPILTDMGLASIYPAEQLYQDLEYFLVNKMKSSPDMAPPSNMTDKEKVQQHGFDVKQSFRHRK